MILPSMALPSISLQNQNTAPAHDKRRLAAHPGLVTATFMSKSIVKY
jgi:hypothetical protein